MDDDEIELIDAIRPKSLASLCRSCEDPAWIGRICMALAGQEVELDYGARQMISVIQSECADFLRSVRKKRERDAIRQREYRERLSRTVTRDNENSENNTVSQTHLHTNLPNQTTHLTTNPLQKGGAGGDNNSITAKDIIENNFLAFDESIRVLDLITVLTNSKERPWRRIVSTIGEQELRETICSFASELKSGEEPNSRAAALMARFKSLNDR